MITLVKDYNNYLRNIPRLISETHYKSEYFVNLLKLKAPTYYRKLKSNSFTTEEVSLITKALYPKEAYLEEIKADLEEAKEDVKKGRVVPHKDVMEALRKKYL